MHYWFKVLSPLLSVLGWCCAKSRVFPMLHCPMWSIFERSKIIIQSHLISAYISSKHCCIIVSTYSRFSPMHICPPNVLWVLAHIGCKGAQLLDHVSYGMPCLLHKAGLLLFVQYIFYYLTPLDTHTSIYPTPLYPSVTYTQEFKGFCALDKYKWRNKWEDNSSIGQFCVQ